MDYNKTIDEKFDEVYQMISAKADKDAFKQLITYGISAVTGFAIAILGLYVLYYSGLTELKVDMKGVQKDIAQINKTLNIATITNED
jgi:hypothetical protein